MNENSNFSATPVLIFLAVVVVILCLMISQTPEMQDYQINDSIELFQEVFADEY